MGESGCRATCCNKKKDLFLSSRSSGGGSGKGNGGDDVVISSKTDDTSLLKKGLNDLGLGFVYSPTLITELKNAGAIYEKDGNLSWTNGWNAQNYRVKLNNFKLTNPSFY